MTERTSKRFRSTESEPRGPDYINVLNKILRVKEITASMIIPIIEKIKILLDEYGLLPT